MGSEFVKPRGRNSGRSCAVASRAGGVKRRQVHTISRRKFVRCSAFAREELQVCGDQRQCRCVKWDALHCRIVGESEFGGLGMTDSRSPDAPSLCSFTTNSLAML